MAASNINNILPTLAVEYGAPGSGLLPSSITQRWSDEQLPPWVAELAGLAPGATFAALEDYSLPNDGVTRDRLCRFAQQLVRARWSSLQKLPAIQPPAHVLRLDLTDIPWSKRTRNSLASAGLGADLARLAHVTFGELLRIPTFGIRSALDFAVTLQSALNSAAFLMDETLSPESSPDSLEDDAPNIDALRALAKEPWAHLVSARDPRFQDLMSPLGKETVADLVEAALSAWDTVEARKAAVALARTHPRLRERIAKIAGQKLEDQLLELFRGIARLEGPRFDALLARFGWGGSAPTTLEEAGQRIGITRERIRQLEVKIRGRLPAHQIFVPALSRAIVELESTSPLDCSAAASLLAQKHISNAKFSPQSVIAAAFDLHEATDLQVSRVRDADLVTLGDGLSLSRIYQHARRLCSAMGVCSAAQICEEIGAVGNRTSKDSDSQPNDSDDSTEDIACQQAVTHALSLTQEIRPLGDGWYWVPGHAQQRNRLVNCSRRMLSVTERISVRRMREGLRRHFKFRNSSGYLNVYLRVPASDVMRRFFLAHPDFEVDANDLVTSTQALDYRQELGPLEQTLVEVLRTSPSPIMDRASVRSACLKRGLNPHSLEMALTYSPVIEHLDLNIWALRGVDANPASLDALREANALRTPGKRLHGFGWTTDGKIWVAARLPESIVGFVLGAPGPVRRFLSGTKFKAVGEDGATYGAVGATDEGSLYGFGGFLRSAGAEEGDILVMEFDLTTSVVNLRVGSDELLDDYEQGQANVKS